MGTLPQALQAKHPPAKCWMIEKDSSHFVRGTHEQIWVRNGEKCAGTPEKIRMFLG